MHFKTRRPEVDNSANALEQAVAKAEIFHGARGDFDAAIVESIIESAAKQFDGAHGGFGHAPKFPHSSVIDLLLERQQWSDGESLRRIAEKTLTSMAAGGFHDQIGGGFHRYSVDERWCVPHFEKMSYDNSELLKNYLHGYQALRLAQYRRGRRGTIAWVNDVLSDQGRGGFYSSQDADQTLDDDGDYFTWTLDEVRAVLTQQEAQVAELYYDVGPHGEMHHNPEKNVLWIAQSLDSVSRELKMSEVEAASLLTSAKSKLLAARRKRQPTPTIDETLYVGWNAMFISAYLEAAHVLDRQDCRAFALKTLDRLLAEAWDPKRGFLHRIGGPSLDGSLDDHVFAIAALLDAWEATLDPRYFQTAESAMRIAVERFGDLEGGGFFDRAKDAPAMGGLDVRRKPLQDSPTPAGNAVAAIVLDRLYALTGDKLYRDWAEKTLEAFAVLAPKYGLFAATYGLAALLHARHPLQVVITGAASDAQPLTRKSRPTEIYRSGKVTLRVTPEQLKAGHLPAALRETLPHMDATHPQAFVCVETTCFPPIDDPAKLGSLLAQVATG